MFYILNPIVALTIEEDIKTFFSNVDLWLAKGGMLSLSYFHPDAWALYDGAVDHFEYKGNIITHTLRMDLSERKSKKGMWLDEYLLDNKRMTYKYLT